MEQLHHPVDSDVGKSARLDGQPYRQNVQSVPPYVIKRLERTGVLDSPEFSQGVNSFVNDSSQAKGENTVVNSHFAHDPFTYSFKNDTFTKKWGSFLDAVSQPKSCYHLNSEINNEEDKVKSSMESLSLNSKSPGPHHEQHPHRDNASVISAVSSFGQVYKGYDFKNTWSGDMRLQQLFGDNTDYRNLEKSVFDASSDHGSIIMTEVVKKRDKEIRDKAREWYESNKKTWKPKIISSLISNAYVPLFFRLFLICISAVSLGFAAHLVVLSKNNHLDQQTSPVMAVIVQSVSILYLFYISYDEFTSQPLGLRNLQAKIRLVLLDLLFIIFASANLSLSFQSMYDSRWVCTTEKEANTLFLPENVLFQSSIMCDQQRGLSGFLLITLFIWCVTFSISIFRIVNVVNSREDIKRW